MNTLIQTDQLEQSNYQNFNSIYEGVKRKGIYLLEYHDPYLKDAFVTQLTEQFISKGSHALFVQEEQPSYSMKDLFLSRMLFRQNPQNVSSISEIKQESLDFLTPQFQSQSDSYIANTKIISPHSHQPHDCLQLISQSLEQNPEIKFVIWESHTDYFNSSNLIPQLSRITFNYKVPTLITSRIFTDKFINKNAFLPSCLQSSLYLHSQHPNLLSLSNSKDIAYQFELDVRTALNKPMKNYFTIRPTTAYCQEG